VSGVALTVVLACNVLVEPHREVLEKLNPSIVRVVRIDRLGGTGQIISGGYVLTNAHVVWPFSEASVEFTDGRTIRGVPVIYHDLITDIAVLGPLRSPEYPIELANAAGEIGNQVNAIGYRETDKRPSAAGGNIIGVQRWDEVGITYYEADVRVQLGFSGGALTDESGDVVGLLGWTFEVAEGDNLKKIAVAADATNVLDRVELIIAGEDVAGLGARPTRSTDWADRFEFELDGRGDIEVFEFVGDASDTLDIELETTEPIRYSVVTASGQSLVDRVYLVGRTAAPKAKIVSTGIVYIVTENLLDAENQVTIKSSAPVGRIVDPDDNRELVPGRMLSGALDHSKDIDRYLVSLLEGQSVKINVRALVSAPGLEITSPIRGTRLLNTGYPALKTVITDTDSLLLKAGVDGTYVVTVYDTRPQPFLGYILTTEFVSDDSKR
jgi:hypothetical protein